MVFFIVGMALAGMAGVGKEQGLAAGAIVFGMEFLREVLPLSLRFLRFGF